MLFSGTISTMMKNDQDQRIFIAPIFYV